MSDLKPCEAIEILESIYPSKKQIVTGEYPEVAEALDMAIAALRRAQPANEPLTLENGFDITNADGTPVDYNALGQKYKDQLCYCDIDQFYIGEDGELVLMDDCGKAVSVDRGDYHIEARPPERSENDGL